MIDSKAKARHSVSLMHYLS